MGRGLIIGLAASLALNVFAVGFISGRVISNDGPPPLRSGPEAGQSFRLMHFADALPMERREGFHHAFREKLPVMRGDFQEMKKLRQEVAALLGAEAWDRAAIETKFDALQTLQRRQQEAFSAAFLDAFETLTPEERQMLRAAADKRRGRHMNHRMRRGERRQPTGDVPPAPKEEE